ncbi:MAG: hypothetical protein U0X39_00915 [Bacteroidales bacterium]
MKLFENLDKYHVRKRSDLSGERVVSVDALRGFDMFWIMGGDMAFKSLDNIFKNRLSGFIKENLDHVDWFGFHFYDIIMPLFLFLVGVSMVYSYRKRLSSAESDSSIWKHTVKRIIILWILGMMIQGNLLMYNPEKIQFYSNTLQAIAAGYLVATIFILYFPVRYQIAATALLLLFYWAIVALVPVGGTTANAYTPERNVAFYVENAVMGKHIGWGTYTWIVSSLNFGATVMLGVFSGYILQSELSKNMKFRFFCFFGASLVALALLLNIWHPIIKKIWTSSFVLFSGGISILLLAFFYLFIDVWGIKRGVKWMIVLGSNAIAGYVAWHLFEKQFLGMADVFIKGMGPYLGAWVETIRYTLAFLIIYFLMWYMYKNKTFIKI